ncbi:MBL fold metallo-hydrolase [Lichenifustis flavocetrariae]|uniref:MBL fold metallo-hydrolase n=1 Tax=Lichenifustis flavocetrariae TaxID=2949735 RepID=A0AA41YZ77_9HYPH|nr:MBL fold metallo-hydrolase [Lichenifustis flavocetrariae]MCW6510839.1 MBL fold metallo-hydrolase [Lichenifustis flavocetrariae]
MRARISLTCFLLFASGYGAALAKPQIVPPSAQAFKLGSLQVFALRDANNVLDNDGKVFGVGVGPDAVARVLKDAGAPTDEVTLSVDGLLVKAADRVMLFDTGLGPSVKGALMASLTQTGVAPDEVTDVMITHSHGDHVGGLATAEGGLAFPKATIRMSAPEWAWMQAQPNSQALAKIIAPKVQTFEPGATVLPGVTSIALPGHTPGHAGFEIVSGSDKLIDIGDTAHSSIVSLAEPDWAIAYDNDKDEGESTRRATLKRLAEDHSLIFAPHFPFPGIGRIETAGDHFSWKPETP